MQRIPSVFPGKCLPKGAGYPRIPSDTPGCPLGCPRKPQDAFGYPGMPSGDLSVLARTRATYLRTWATYLRTCICRVPAGPEIQVNFPLVCIRQV